MENLLQDLRFGIRMLLKNRGFATIAILVLAVGIGANTAIFSLVNSMLLRPLPYPDAGRLVMLSDMARPNSPSVMAYPRFLAWRSQNNIFEDVATYYNEGAALTGVAEPEKVQAVRISSNLLPMLGVAPNPGRGFTADEERRDGGFVAILTRPFWASHYHSDPSALGKTLTLNNKIYTIIGVLQEEFHFGNKPDVILPLNLDAKSGPPGMNFLGVIGKRRMGIDQTRSAVAAALPSVNEMAQRNSVGTQVDPLQAFMIGDSKGLLLALLGSVGFVLLLACANTANLLLARAAAREKEIAVRVSVGAGRSRVVRQLLTESVLLSACGGALGLVLAWSGVGVVTNLLANRLPNATVIHVDGWVLAFTVLLSLVTGLVFGSFPALQLSRGNTQEQLKQGSRVAGGATGIRNALVVAEIALSLVLLAGAGLFLRSFLVMMNVDKGFDSAHVLTMNVTPSPNKYSDPGNESAYLRQILERAQAFPSVKSAGLTSGLPLARQNIIGEFGIENRPDDPKNPLMVKMRFVAGDYLQAMRIPLVSGRYLNTTDIDGSPRVVLVSQSLAHKYFPGENPMGQHIDLGWGKSAFFEIVGVVGDVKDDNLASPGDPTFYAPLYQKPELLTKIPTHLLVIRTDRDPASLIEGIRAQIRQLDSDQVVSEVQPMDDIVSGSLSAQRSPAWLFGAFGVVALFLASIGIYGVLSSYVQQRRQEIGIRMALGAQRVNVLQLIGGRALMLIATGLVLGFIAAFIAARTLTSLLSGVQATDLSTFIGASLVLATFAMLACCIPAVQAIRVDPLTVLRSE